MNIYAGVPEQNELTDWFLELQTKAFEMQIRDAITELTMGHQGKYEAVVKLLGLFIGETQQ